MPVTFDLYNDKLPLCLDVHSKTTAWVMFVTSTLVDANNATRWENVVTTVHNVIGSSKEVSVCVEVFTHINDNELK